MAEGAKQYSHLEVQKVNVEPPRRKVGGGRPPKRENVTYGRDLLEKVEVLKVDFDKILETTPPEFDPAMIFSIKLDGHVDEKDFLRSGLILLGEEPGDNVVLFSQDQLEEFTKRLAGYSEEIPSDQKGPHYSWIASLTNEMKLWGREERLGSKLAAIEIEPNTLYIVDVELWSYGSQDDQGKRLEELRSFLKSNSGEILDNYVTPYICIARVRLDGNALDALLDVGIVQVVDLPPQPASVVSELMSLSVDDLKLPISSPTDESPGVGILDTGLISGHPLLQPAVGDVRAIPARFGDGADDHGHGTRVAGVVLYGDLKEAASQLKFVPEIYIFAVKVTNKDNRFDDEKLIVTQMIDAITAINKEYGCRVFNISLGDPKQVYRGGKPSPWAYILDVLARELNLVIVVSSGNNDEVFSQKDDVADRTRREYPRYLLTESCRIIEPATAANVLTVGSLNGSESSEQAARNPNDPGIQVIGPSLFPSPFSRSGPGVNGSIKPELADSGGSFVWSRYAHGFAYDRELKIISTGHQLTQGLFDHDIGSSYSAAKVSNLAGLILKKYPLASANLIRALIASSAEVPGELLNSVSRHEALSLVGYGKPDSTRALFSSESRTTIFAQEEIGIDNLHLFTIPLPKEFTSTRGRRRISISLAFDPPVRHTRKDYLGFLMGFHLFRGLSSQRVVDYYSQRPKDFKPEDIPDRFHCTTHPGPQIRGRGTLQKASFNFARNSVLENYPGEGLQLLIACKAGWASEKEFGRQKYAVAVTLEHLAEPIEMYNSIRRALRVPVRTRARG